MNIRSNGKRLAIGITTAATLGSLATAGVASAVVYANTVATKSTGTTTSTESGSGATNNHSTRPGKSYSRVSPVQPGSGAAVHGNSSGS